LYNFWTGFLQNLFFPQFLFFLYNKHLKSTLADFENKKKNLLLVPQQQEGEGSKPYRRTLYVYNSCHLLISSFRGDQE
jgi:hypothetical protein